MAYDDPIDEVLADWRERRDAGERVEPEEVIAAHPEIAESLRARFEAMASFEDDRRGRRAAIDSRLRAVAADRYSEFRVLGQGGMGIVYWALDTDLNRQVAFKVIRPDAGTSGSNEAPAAPIGLAPPGDGSPVSQAFDTLKARFLQEAWVTAGLEHPGIVPVYEVGATPGGVPYYTMRFVKGSRTLAAAMSETKSQPMDARLVLLEPFLKVCDTIRYAHAHGVIHRDLKPDNVALGEFGEVVVLDWGLAKVRDGEDTAGARWQDRIREYRAAADLKTLASALGTPGYMAPEAALGRSHEVDERSDVYSLGAILFQILAGRLPFEFRTYVELLREMLNGTPPEAVSIEASVPAELSNLCTRALSRNRDARPASVAALADEIRGWQRDRERAAEVAALVAEAEGARDGLEKETGEALLRRVDRLQAVCSRLLAVSPGHPRGEVLAGEAESLQERAIVEREKLAREQVRRRARNLSFAGAAVGAIGFIWLLATKKAEVGDALAKAEEQRGIAESERDHVKSERDAKHAALAQVSAERDAKDAALSAKTEALAAEKAALRRAEGLRLVAESSAALATDPALALLLAREANDRVPGLAARNAALEALQSLREERVLAGHTGRVTRLAFSPGGDRLLSTSADGTVRVWDVATGRASTVIRAGGGPFGVGAASFLANARSVVTCDFEGGVRVWDAATGAMIRTVGSKNAPAILSDDGAVAVLTAGFDVTSDDAAADKTSISCFDVATGAKRCDVASPAEGSILPVALDPTGACVLCTAMPSRRSLVVDTSTGTVRCSFDALPAAMATLGVFSPGGGTLLLYAPGASGAQVVDTTTGKVLHRLASEGVADMTVAVGMSPDGRRVLIGRGAPQIWDAAAGTVAASLQGIGGTLLAAEFSADGAAVATLTSAGTADVWNAQTGARLAALGGHASFGACVRFAPDGRHVATGTPEGTIHVWRTDRLPEVAVLAGHGGPVDAAAFSRDGRRIVTATGADAARVWDAATGRQLLVLRGGSETPDAARADEQSMALVLFGNPAAKTLGWCPVVAFSDDGTRVLTSGIAHDFRSRAWDAVTGRDLATGIAGSLHAAAFLGDGRRVLELGKAGVFVGPLGGGPRVDLDLPQSGEGAGMGWFWMSAAGERVAMLSSGREAGVWDAATGKRVRSFGKARQETRPHIVFIGNGESVLFDAGPGEVVTARADGTGAAAAVPGLAADERGHVVSGDGKLLATWSAGAGGPCRVREIAGGDEVCVLRGPAVVSGFAAFSPDGRRLVTACTDRPARVWDVATGEEVLTLAGHDGPPTAACFSPDGRLVLTISDDRTARLWPVDPIALAASVAPRALTAEEIRRFDLHRADQR